MEDKSYTLALGPALIHARCPRCRRGKLFSNSMYGFSGQIMNTTCGHCGLTFEPEPGYFYVAMFVSYAMNVAQMVTTAIIINFFTGSNNPWLYISVILGITISLAPFNFRYSRVILLYWLTPGLHYHPEMSKDNESDRAL